MSIRAMSAARDITDIPPVEKFVLMALCDYASDQGVAWPSLNSLRAWTCLGRSTLLRALGGLEKRGLIERVAMIRKDGSRASSDYLLRFMEPDADMADRYVASCGAKARGVPERDGGGPRAGRGGPAATPLELSVELPEELPEEPQPTSTSSTPSPRKNETDSQVQDLVDIWNAHRGVLPSTKVVSSKRKAALVRFIREAGSFGSAKEVMERGTKLVAQDGFWRKNKYGLDVLLAGDKVFQKSESYEAQETADAPICSVGDSVRFKSVMGRMEEGEVTEVNEKQVAVRQQRDGRIVRVPLGSILEVLA